MNDTIQSPGDGSTLTILLALLEADQANRELLADAAEAALDERKPEVASDLIGRIAAAGDLRPREVNLAALAALQSGEFEKVVKLLESLPGDAAGAPGVRFNLAWASAKMGDFDRALAALDGSVTQALPQAATLHVQLLHQAGHLDEASEAGRSYLTAHPENRDLMAAMSVLAIDLEDLELAEHCAAGAADHPDALTTLGTLALGREHATDALSLFDQAVTRDPTRPRAWVGRGLAKLLTGNGEDAAADIDEGAAMFGDHLGSWIAAGWAHFVRGDLKASRARFETALAIDPNFAETHGSLAVLAVVEGNPETARRESDVALRLDRQCYSAALALSLLAAGEGKHSAAQRIFARAAEVPVDASGRTIAAALASMGLGIGTSAPSA